MAETNTNRNIVAALSYFLGFITGVIILLVEKQDKYVRFHAMQSVVIFGALFVFNLVFSIVFGTLTFLGVLASIIEKLVSIVSVVVWVISMIKAYQGIVYKWPIAGDFAEKQVGKAS